MIINEQIRLYNEKMDEIEQLEYAEALAVNQLKLKRQNTVRNKVLPRSGSLFGTSYNGNNIKFVIVAQPHAWI